MLEYCCWNMLAGERQEIREQERGIRELRIDLFDFQRNGETKTKNENSKIQNSESPANFMEHRLPNTIIIHQNPEHLQ